MADNYYVSKERGAWQISCWGEDGQFSFDLKTCPYVIYGEFGAVLVEVRYGMLVVGGFHAPTLVRPEFSVLLDTVHNGWKIIVQSPAKLVRLDEWAEEQGQREVQQRLAKAAKIRAQIGELRAELAALSPSDAGV